MLAVSLGSTASAPAAEPDHVFGGSIKGGGTSCAISEPGGVAVDEATHNVYVYDRGTNAIDVFDGSGNCLVHQKAGAGEFGEETNEGIAFDNSAGSPSHGAVYVVNAEKKEILKYKLEEVEGKHKLKLIGQIKKFKLVEENEGKKEVLEEFEEFEEIHGLATDGNGRLWVYEAEFLDEFSNTQPNTGILVSRFATESPAGCTPLPGFGLASNATTGDPEFFYVGRERQNLKEECEEADVLMKVNSAGEPATGEGEPPFKAQLDNEPTSGAAVDRKTSEVYFDNKTSISAFGSGGVFNERFGDEAGPGQLHEGTGVAVDSETNHAYVADLSGGEGEIKVYVPNTEPEPKPEPKPPLPDGRAWEMVSPPNKFGAAIYGITLGIGGIVQASEDGNAITYTANAPIVADPPTNRSPEPASLLSRRGATWTTEGIATPRSQTPTGWASASGAEYEFFSSDLSTGLLNPDFHGLTTTAAEPPLSPEATESTPYRRDLTHPSSECEPVPSTCYRALVSPLNATGEFGKAVFITSATPDASHVVLKSGVKLNAEAKQENGLYEEGPSGALQLVSAWPEGEEEGNGAEARLGGPGLQNGGLMRNAISQDGTRVIWSTSAGSAEPEKLYVRDMAKHETVRIDKAQGVAEPEEQGARFNTASTDGSKIFFTDTQPLTPDSTTEAEVEETEGQGDLYACELVEEGGKLACKLTDLTAEVKAANENAAVQGVPGASEDGSYVYFVANGVLASHAGRGHCQTSELTFLEEIQKGLPVASCNLYVAHFDTETKAWEKPRFVAALTSEDAADWRTLVELGTLTAMTSRVSPNGQYIAFMSNRSLTGYDNRDTHPEAKDARDEELFLYSTASDKIVCASCNPSGERPSGVFDTPVTGEGIGLLIDRPQLWSGRWLAANVPGWTARSKETAPHQSRYLSDTGRLIFNSADGLVPADTNGKADVYEFEPNGEGSCTSSTGCVSLLSNGLSKQESAFLDASASGNDVFFLTSDKLVPSQDLDTGFDIYDARVCTAASPCIQPPGEPAPPCSTEDQCKGTSSSQPALPGAPPSSLPGTGNAPKVEVLGEKKNEPKALTRAQKLKKALKACKKLKKKKKRAACVRKAKKKYGPVKKGKSHKSAFASHRGRR